MEQWINILINKLACIGIKPNDSQEVRLEKNLLVTSALMMSTAGIFWGLLYLSFGENLAGVIPLTYSALSYLSLIYFALTRRYGLFRFSQLTFSLLLPFLLMITLGGFVYGSAVVLWSFTAPVGALVFAGRRQGIYWFISYLVLVTISGVLQALTYPVNSLPPGLVLAFFVLNISGVSMVAFVLLQYFVSQKNQALALLDREREKSERLLLNVLPAEIAAILKDESRTIAEYYDSVSVLFADMVGSTPLAAQMSPVEWVDLLNKVFLNFDELVAKYGVEKIRTIGDNYMVASGIPRPRPDHAQVLADLALEMIAHLEEMRSLAIPVTFRIGINSGPAVAGVIGKEKFHYDLWGDAVNIASRMESHGTPGKIHITHATYELLREKYECEPHGKVEVKGKGEMETWFLTGRKNVDLLSQH